MISSAVMTRPSDFRESVSRGVPFIGIENYQCEIKTCIVNTRQLLDELEERGVRNVDIAHALKLSQTRASEIRKGDRRLMFDEGMRLIEEFGLQEKSGQISSQVAVLAVAHIAGTLGMEIDGTRLSDLAGDLQALIAFAADPRVSSDALEAFSRGLLVRRQLPAEHRLPLRGNL